MDANLRRRLKENNILKVVIVCINIKNAYQMSVIATVLFLPYSAIYLIKLVKM